jgi:hypothetical protein
MNLGMLGAIGGAGKAVAGIGQDNDNRQMEMYKMQVEQDMRDRAEERRMSTAGRAQQQARAANAADAQAVDVAYGKQQLQNQTDTINSTNGSSATAEDVATANAGNPLNASQRAAYGIQDAPRNEELGAKADIALRQGNPDLSKSITAQQQIEINQQNADTKQELRELKNRVDKGQGLTANNRDWQAWKQGEKSKGKSDTETTFGDYMKFVKQMDLGNYKAYTSSQRGVVLNPDAEKPEGMQDGQDQVVDYNTFFKK